MALINKDPLRIKILLYYKYVKLDNPFEIDKWQKELCTKLNLKGRVLISEEGINGTLAGAENEINEYILETQKLKEFSDMEWKVSWADEQVFPKLKVVVRDEVVTLGIKKSGQDVSIANKADYIEPEELKKMYDEQKDFVIVDARNDYEATVGKFKNAIVPPIYSFRDFPEFVEKDLSQYKDKEVITYCTGGVRCEKASAYLKEQGFTKVRQLHGGIHEYGVKAGGKHFEGEMFVFDKRLHVPVNIINPTTLTECIYCQKAITRYIDCAISSCDGLFICCRDCEKQYEGTCSETCLEKIKMIPVLSTIFSTSAFL